MSALAYLPIPTLAPPPEGPWTLRWTRPDGSLFRGDDGEGPHVLFDTLADAEHWREIAERDNLDGCRVDVVPARSSR